MRLCRIVPIALLTSLPILFGTVTVSTDPMTTPPDRLRDLRVEMTLLGGRTVYERDAGS